MIFKIKLSSSVKDFSKKSDAGLVKFFIETKNLKSDFKKYLDGRNLKVSPTYTKRFLSKDGDELKLNFPDSKPDLIYFKKIKLDDKFDVDIFRNYLSKLIIEIKKLPISSLQIELPKFSELKKYFSDEKYFYQTVVEGLLLGNYTFDLYKSKSKIPQKLEINLSGGNHKIISAAIKDGTNLLDAVNFAKDLSNEPAITLTPAELVKRTKSQLSKVGIKVVAFNKAVLSKKKMNAILAVGGGSDNPPYLLTMHYKPRGKSKKKIVLVGKGVTYDSGGLSIKPTDGMLEMNADMAGASTVIGTILAAAKNKLPVEIIGIVPAVENMISGKSYKPGDIVRTASGKSIEVKNTDAEGRIVLADALEYASSLKPDIIIDFATLTGACVIALGEFIAGVFTKNDTLAGELADSGNKTFERVWRMPFFDDFSKQLESDLADVSNLGSRWGGAITAGKFLENFVDKNITWAHIDLAGPALKHKFRSYTEKYNTGFGVRLMYDFLKKI